MRRWSDGGRSHLEANGDEDGFFVKSNLGGKILLMSNVGIRHNRPQGLKVSCAGNAIAESVTVKMQTAWPDYVFNPAYKLRNLTEVDAYINQNQHLPDMPSAEEVKANGVNLGEIVKRQTKKIEELTLYLIDQQKKNEQQNIRIANLEKALGLIVKAGKSRSTGK